jgi:glycosyltransferase involved in cell wall biosynthesis
VRRRYDVCAAVVSDLQYDGRVWKEARSLAAAGHAVRLLGCRYEANRAVRRVERGIDVCERPFGPRHRRLLRLRRARALLGLWATILWTRARVYHAHNVHVVPAAYVAARLRRARLVYDAHELYGERAGRSGLRGRLAARASGTIERLAVTRADAVITTNPSRARVLDERYGRTGAQILANVPLPVEELEPLDPGFPPGRTIVLFQGAVIPEGRAFEESVQALVHLPDADLVVLGFGREEVFARVRRAAERAGVSERVHFLPPRPFEDLVRTAAAADVGIVPILPDSTARVLGDTNKLHEYLMAGLPVVASDLPEIRRVVTEGDPPVGEFFDPRDPRSIAGAVQRLLADGDAYRRRRTEARRLALEKHNWRIEERRLLSLYDSLLRPVVPAASPADAIP